MAWDPELGVLTVGERSVTLTCVAGDNECVLRTYLHLVAEQRAMPLDRSIVLRRDDVLVLAEILDLDDSRLEQRLATILRLSDPEARALRRDLLRQRVAVAAIGVGLVAGFPLGRDVAAADDATPEAVPAVAEVAADPAPAVPELRIVPKANIVTVEVAPPTTEVVDTAPEVEAPAPPPPAAAVAAPVEEVVAPVIELVTPQPEPDAEVDYSVTYERDPNFESTNGTEIGDAMVIQRDVPPAG